VIKDSQVAKGPLDAYGPVGERLSALLLARSSVTIQGLFVLPGVIDSDYMGQINTMVWTLTSPVTVPAGSRIAQLIRFRACIKNTQNVKRGSRGFGSTGATQIFLGQQINHSRPTLTCTLLFAKGHPPAVVITGMIDTGADVTIISTRSWPKKWLTISTTSNLSAIGGFTQGLQIRFMIQVQSPEKPSGHLMTLCCKCTAELVGP